MLHMSKERLAIAKRDGDTLSWNTLEIWAAESTEAIKANGPGWSYLGLSGKCTVHHMHFDVMYGLENLEKHPEPLNPASMIKFRLNLKGRSPRDPIWLFGGSR